MNSLSEQAAGQNTNSVVSPDGTAVGVARAHFTGNESDPTGQVYIFNRTSDDSQTTYGTGIHTSSVFVKPGLETKWKFAAHSQYASASAGGAAAFLGFDFTLTGDGTLDSMSTGGIAHSIEKYPNGWYRLSITYYRNSTANVESPYGVILYPRQHNTYNNFVSNTGLTSGELAYFWGPQVEAGEIATSYIPTNDAEATRSPDLVSIEGDNFGTYRTNKIVQTKQWQPPFSAVVSTGTVITRHADANPVTGEYDAIKATITNVGTDASVQQNLSASGGSGAIPNDGTKVVFSFYARTDSGTLNLKPKLGRQGSNAFTSQSPITITDQWARYQVNDNGLDAGNTKTHYGLQILDVSKPLYTYGWQVEIVASNSSQATEYIPSTDTYTNRQSDATFVDGNGIIRHSRANKLQNTRTLSAPWSGENLTVTNSSEVTPDGDTTAKKFTKNITLNYNFARIRHVQNTVSFVDVVHTTSVYVKADGLRYLHFRHGNANGGFGTAFDLQEGTILAQGYRDNNVLLATPISSAIEDAGNGWYRCSITSLLSDLTMWFGVSNSATVTNATDDEGGSMHFWHPQTVKGTEIIPFIPTDATPAALARYSHDPETLTPTGLYLEPAATNIVRAATLRSGGTNQQITNSESDQAAGLNADGVLSPMGTTKNVCKVFLDGTETGTTAFRVHNPNNADYATQNKHTSSMFIKPSYVTRWRMAVSNNFASATDGGDEAFMTTDFILTGDGSITAIASGLAAAGTPTVKKYPNGWYRISITYFRSNHTGSEVVNRDAAVLVFPVINGFYIGSQNVTGTPVSVYSVIPFTQAEVQASPITFGYLFGPQAEEGVVPTSYIPTSGEEATRAADIFTSTATEVLDRANGTKPAFYTKNGLTAFVRGTNQPNPPTYAFRFFEFTGGIAPGNADFSATANSNGTKVGVFQHEDTSHAEPQGISSGASSPNTTLGLDNKIAIRYQTDNLRVNVNGVEGNLIDSTVGDGVDTRSSNRLCIGANGGASGVGTSRIINGTIQRLTFWKTPLTDSKLDKLTTDIT
jgi:hypothetical protein